MGTLQQIDGGRRITLGTRMVIGRARGCDLELGAPRVSGQHAALRYKDGVWRLRDLGSSNGTFVGGKRVEPGAAATLVEGAALGFGSAEASWTLLDASAPGARARHLASDTVVDTEDGLLAIPSSAAPRITVFHDARQGWTAEVDGRARSVADQEVLAVPEAGEWRLELPTAVSEELLASTVKGGPLAPRVDDIELALRVSGDEEYVEIDVVTPLGAERLKPRAFHYMLVLLARHRLEDAADEPSEGSAEDGWVYVESLCKDLGVDEYKLNVDIFRARKQLAKVGVLDAARLVERRRTTQQLRMGVERLSVGGL